MESPGRSRRSREMVVRQHDGMVVEEVAALAEETTQTEPPHASMGEGDEADEYDGTRDRDASRGDGGRSICRRSTGS